MTREILVWLERVKGLYLPLPGDVLEVGSRNVNGSPRHLFLNAATYTGTDMEAGPGVDAVVNNTDLLNTFHCGEFDTVLCLECLEHDQVFWQTIQTLRALLRPGGALVITTPSFGFPEHRYPRHYVNFGTDAFREWFFAGMEILELTTLTSDFGAGTTVAGIARKP